MKKNTKVDENTLDRCFLNDPFRISTVGENTWQPAK